MFMKTILLLLSISAFSGEPDVQTHVTHVRGGRPVDPRDAVYYPVVALERTYRKFNEETMAYETKTSICSGTVINRVCVLTAAHCAAGPGEENISIQVYNAHKIKGATPVANVSRTLVRGDYAIENDIAMLRIDKVAPETQTVYTSNLHAKTDKPLSINDLVKIVGYGVFNENYDEATGKRTNVGSGEKRDGDMKVAKTLDGKSPLVEVEPTKGNHSAAPGDSGGPLILHENGRTTVYGVTGSIDANVANAHTNYYTSVAYHRKWIESATQELDCTEASAHKRNLEQFVHKEFPDYSAAVEQLKKIKSIDPVVREELLTRIWNAGIFGKDLGVYQNVRILGASLHPTTGELLLRWEGIFSDDPGLDQNIMIRQGGKRAGGTMVIALPPKKSREDLIPPVFRQSREGLTEPVLRERK